MFGCPKCHKELPDGAAWCCWCGAKLVATRRAKVRSNGEGSVYQYGTAGKWRAEINIFRDGVRYHKIKSGFKTQRDALQALPELRELVSLLRYSSNNLNQLTRRAHETGRIYEADLEDIQQSQERIWTAAEKIVSSLAALK